MPNLIHTLVFALLVLTSSAFAQTLYKSVGPDGKIVYSDKPPVSGRLEKTLDVQALPNTAIPPETLKEIERLKREGKRPAVTPTGFVLFSASWCGYCRQAKSHLAGRGITYREYDIDTPEGRSTFSQASGGGGVPLLLKAGEKLRGYSHDGYEAFLSKR